MLSIPYFMRIFSMFWLLLSIIGFDWGYSIEYLLHQWNINTILNHSVTYSQQNPFLPYTILSQVNVIKVSVSGKSYWL